VPPPVPNGLKTISKTNCLSVASFRTAGFHLFGARNPAELGKASGSFLLLSFSLTRQKNEVAGGQPPPVLYAFKKFCKHSLPT
jgi:hypothetical protein